MTQDKSVNRGGLVKALLMRAWRERWSASQYGTQIKGVLGKGSSGDDCGLSDQIIQLAVNGPSPNQLLLSLLNHSLASQLVTYAGTLVSVSKYNKYSRPHCTGALLDLIIEHKPYITTRGGVDECVSLGTSLVSLATWVFNTASTTIARLIDSRDNHSQIDDRNFEKCVDLLDWFLNNKFIASLLYTGRFQDQELHQEFIIAAKGLSKISDQNYVYHGTSEKEEKLLKARIKDLVPRIRSSDPAQHLNKVSDGPSLMLTLQSLLSFDVILQPTSDLTQLAGQLVVIMNIRNVPIQSLVCELTRCCLLGMNDVDRFEVLRWDAFALLKLHRLVDKIINEHKTGDTEEVVYQGLHQVLQYTALLDMTDAKCKANTFELIVSSFSAERRKKNPLVSESEAEKLLAARQKQLEARKHIEIKGAQYSESRDIAMTFKADTTIQTIINTFENRTTESTEFDNLLSVMFHIVKGSSFDLLLSAATANGTLTALVSKLLFFNQGTQESMGESNKVAQNRAALFDMTFLMLVYMVQCFSTSSLLPPNLEGFFPKWAKLCMAEPGNVKPLEAFKQLGGQESLVDGLLQQIMQGEIRTQVIKWNHVCSSVHDVMKEILVGVEMGTINNETFNRLTLQLGTKLCCFPICIASWLVSSAHFGQGDAKGRRPSAMACLDMFINIPPGEDTDTRPYFAKRSTMMTNILKKMRREMEESKADGGGKAELSAAFDKLWETVWEKRILNIAATKEIARLYNIGGAEWLMNVLVEKMKSQVYNEDVERCTETVFSLMHIDLPASTLALLVHVLPNILTGPEGKDGLCYPAVTALARLTVSALAAVLKMKNSQPYSTKRKWRSADLDDLCNNHAQPVKLRRLASGDPSPAGEPAPTTQDNLIHQAHVGLFELMKGLCTESTLSSKLEFVACILEECVRLGREESIVLLSPLSADLVTHLIRLQPHRFPVESLLRLFDPNHEEGRAHILSSLVLLRNIRKKKKVGD